MEMILSLFMNSPFLQGLSLGAAVALVMFFWGLLERRQLRNHLISHMKIYGTGEKSLLSENEKLKEQVGNLKSRVAEYRLKPGRAELRELYLLDRSIRLMNQRAPGFGAAWELTRVEIEKQIEEADSGIIAWSKNVVLPHDSWVRRMDTQLDASSHADRNT